jgi:hypothetical protein
MLGFFGAPSSSLSSSSSEDPPAGRDPYQDPFFLPFPEYIPPPPPPAFLASAHSGSSRRPLRERTYTEPQARDSFENLLFSIARFRALTGSYPSRITVVGFEFKRRRFLDLHRVAIRFPSSRFGYAGIDPMEGKGQETLSEKDSIRQRLEREQGEETNAVVPFSRDPYGCRDPLLSKKLERNPFAHCPLAEVAGWAPELAGLVSWCGMKEGGQAGRIFSGRLPWDDLR